MERIQIDLSDMRHCPDCDFHYIGHFADHMTKFNILFPIKDTKRTSSSTSFLKVLSESKVFDVMHNVHVNEFKHAGYKKCREHVSILFYITSISKYEVKIKLLKVIIFLLKIYFISDSKQPATFKNSAKLVQHVN